MTTAEPSAGIRVAAVSMTPTGYERLSYRRSAELFTDATTGEHGGPWTLHQLRHSALTHAAEQGASTPLLMALSGHTSTRSLARYARSALRLCSGGSKNATPVELVVDHGHRDAPAALNKILDLHTIHTWCADSRHMPWFCLSRTSFGYLVEDT